MRWEELEDALEVLETEREHDGYFCSIKDVSYHRDFGKSMRFAKRKENTCMGDNRACQNISVRNIWHQTDTVLLVAVELACSGKSCIA